MLINFHFLVPEAFIQNLVQNGSVVSEKIRFEFLYVHDLAPRSRNDPDLLHLQNCNVKFQNFQRVITKKIK